MATAARFENTKQAIFVKQTAEAWMVKAQNEAAAYAAVDAALVETQARAIAWDVAHGTLTSRMNPSDWTATLLNADGAEVAHCYGYRTVNGGIHVVGGKFMGAPAAGASLEVEKGFALYVERIVTGNPIPVGEAA